MKVVDQRTEFYGETPCGDQETIGKFIEKIGRICYQSFEKMTVDSWERFTTMLFDNNHKAMFDHSNIVLKLSNQTFNSICAILISKDLGNRLGFHRTCDCIDSSDKKLMNGNLRAWFETLSLIKEDIGTQSILNILNKEYPLFFKESFNLSSSYDNVIELITDPSNVPESLKMFTFVYITNRGVTHELVRHSPPGYAQSSTRWIKFKNGITHIRPFGFNIKCGEYSYNQHSKEICYRENLESDFLRITPGEYSEAEVRWLQMGLLSEDSYEKISESQKAQIARGVLMTDLETMIAMTTDMQELNLIISQRTAKDAHPQIQEIMNSTREILKDVTSS